MDLTLAGFEIDSVVGQYIRETLGDGAHGHRRDGPGGDLIHAPDSSAALRASDHTLDEPVHAQDLVEGELGAVRNFHRARLVLQRACELIERAGDQGLLLGIYRGLSGGVDRRSEWRDVDQVVL